MSAEQGSSSAPRLDLRKFYGRSCVPEVSEPVGGVLQGAMPAWLRGKLLRNGPGANGIGPDRYNHVFDGPALVRQFSIENGRVLYQNRFLQSQAYIRNRRANRIVVSEFGTMAHPDPCASVFERLASYFSPDVTDNALVNVMPIGDEVYALTETPYMLRVDPDTLETLDRKNLSDLVAVHIATAHPLLDPTDGATYNVGTQMAGRPCFVLVRFPHGASSVDRASAVGKVETQSRMFVPYIHSFALTEQWVVILEQSLGMHVPSMLRRRYFGGGSFMTALKFDAKKNVRFHVMNKRTGELHPAVFEAPAFFTFHHVNAFERAEEIVVDLCGYDDGRIISDLDYTAQDGGGFNLGYLWRFTLPLNRGPGERVCVQPQTLAKGNLRGDLPRVNDGWIGKPYRFAYALSQLQDEMHKAFLSKTDFTTGDWLRWEREGWLPSEPVFVARPGAVEEDDGVILSSLVHGDDEKKLALVVLDARTFEQLAIVDFECPQPIPADFHGWFLPQENEKA